MISCVYSVWKRRRPAHTQYTHDKPSSHPFGQSKNFGSQAGLLTIYIQFRAKNLKSMTSEISCQCIYLQPQAANSHTLRNFISRCFNGAKCHKFVVRFSGPKQLISGLIYLTNLLFIFWGQNYCFLLLQGQSDLLFHTAVPKQLTGPIFHGQKNWLLQ